MQRKVTILLTLFAFIINHGQAQNTCLDLDGQDDYVNLPLQDLTGYDAITLEAWINPDANVNQTYQNILRQNSPGLPASYLLAYQNGSTIISFGINTQQGYKELDHPVNPNQFSGIWTHVAGTYDGSMMRMYLNGILVDSVQHIGLLYMPNPNGHFIGRRAGSTPTEYYHGLVDEVRIWTIARSQFDIFNDMNCALNGLKPGMLAVYNLNENQGVVAHDASGNGFDGTIMNGAAWIGSPVAPVCPVGLYNPSEAIEISVFPNPANNNFSILLKTALQENLYVDIYNAYGQVVTSAIKLQFGPNEFHDILKCSGLYYVTVRNSHRIIRSFSVNNIN